MHMEHGPLSFTLPEEERRLLALTHEVCRELVVPRRAELDESGEFPHDILRRFREIGLFRAMFDAEFDGLGLHPLLPMFIAETLGEYCAAVGTIFWGTTMIAAQPFLVGGTAEQKRKYLPKLASGEWLGSFAISEPQAGSDITCLSTSAVRDDDHYVLNGEKKWVTNAGEADLYCVFAVTDPAKDQRVGVSCFVVGRDAPGLSVGRLENKLGIRCAPVRSLTLKDVKVPSENLLGLVPGRGFTHAMQSITRSRIGVAAFGVGLATAAYREAVRYTHGRKQFGKRINEFQSVQHMLADMLVKIETARALTHKAGWATLVADDPEAKRYSAMAKYYASEIAMQVATDALQLHGGYGYTKECPVEKMFRDAKILSIYEGTSQILKSQIAISILQEAARGGQR
jgi:alkylation response protein AidB-like acyl-CoA dehydrogenase